MWELDHKEGWVLKSWCFQTVVLEKTLESPLDIKEIKSVHPKRNQSWIFTGRTNAEAPILSPPDLKSWLLGKEFDAEKDWGQEEKGICDPDTPNYKWILWESMTFQSLTHLDSHPHCSIQKLCHLGQDYFNFLNGRGIIIIS